MAFFRHIAVAAVLAAIAMPAMAAEQLTVYRSPSCGCCLGWVKYLKVKGFDATVETSDDMGAVKARLHVPGDMQSCHTAVIAGYVVEGHVPVEAIVKLLAERPAVTGIAAPGMPQGSPGMSGAKEHFEVYSFGPSGVAPFMAF